MVFHLDTDLPRELAPLAWMIGRWEGAGVVGYPTIEEGRYEQAAQLFSRAVETEPRAAPIFNRLGVVLATRLRRYDEACVALEQAVALEPDNAVYKNNFAKVAAMANEGLSASKKPLD